MRGTDLTGAVLDDRYQVIEPIAEGAMGAVYRGERLKLGRAVAIKIMHDALPDELASRQRFEREAKLMARLEHPHCVSVIDFGLHDGKPFLVMDLVRGTSLQEALSRVGRYEPARAAEIARQILSGLAHAHELGIVHRDIKPANIMLTERTGLGEQVQILDFGLARPTSDSTKLTTGIVVGTPNYMAPEQITGSASLDGRADVYAVGVVLFELLTGLKPFVADDPLAVVRKHLNTPPPTLAEYAPGVVFGELEDVVARALQKVPIMRYQTAGEMAAAIEQAITKRTATAELMARAVPQRMATVQSGPARAVEPSGAKIATASGWAVPNGDVSVPAPVVAGMIEVATGPVSTGGGGGGVVASNSVVVASGAIDPSGGATGVVVTGGGVVSGGTAGDGVASGAVAHGGIDAVPEPLTVSQTRRRAVPPTRLNPTVRPRFAGLPITRTQAAIGGGALAILVIAVIAAKSGGGAHGVQPTTAGSATAQVHPDATSVDPLAPALARASDLYANGDLDPALDVVTRARRQHADSAQLAFLAGKIYFAKLYWTDGIKAFRDAIRLDPAYRTDPELGKIAIRGFITTPDTDARLEEFLRQDLGETVKPALQETAKTHPNAVIRSRAAAELRRFQ